MSWRVTASDLELAVSCEGAQHRITWSQGSVGLPNHPDLAAERALIALGGGEPACLSHLRLWHDAVADGGFLAEWVDENHLTAAHISWLGTALERMRLEGFHEFLRHLPPARAERMGLFVHRFPRPWIDRAACEVAEAIDHPTSGGPADAEGEKESEKGGVRCRHAPGLIEQAVASRLRRAFVDSIGGGQLSWGAAALVPLHITVDAEGAPAVEGRLRGSGRGVRIAVGPSWLHQVWGAGAPLIGGRLVLALDDSCDAFGPDHGSDTGARLPLGQARAAMVIWRNRSADEAGIPLTTGEVPAPVAVEWRRVRYSSGRWHLHPC